MKQFIYQYLSPPTAPLISIYILDIYIYISHQTSPDLLLLNRVKYLLQVVNLDCDEILECLIYNILKDRTGDIVKFSASGDKITWSI